VQTEVDALAGLVDLDHHGVGVVDDGAGDVLEHAPGQGAERPVTRHVVDLIDLPVGRKVDLRI
jgi:hypothetical protein